MKNLIFLGENEVRLDVFLVEQGDYPRTYASDLIKKGFVTVNDKVVTKSGYKLSRKSEIIVSAEDMKYVSRGGYKLEKALLFFDISVENKICLDVGSSTGGFTDCLLQNGAKKIYAVDSGFSQLAERLKADKRVISMEKTNILDFRLPEPVDLVVVDVSFVSLSKILPTLWKFLQNTNELILLIKPQFEAGASYVTKNGIVLDKKIHKLVISNLINEINQLDINFAGLTFSPISGGDGNIEYLAYCNLTKNFSFDLNKVTSCVEEAFSTLGKK